MLNITIVLYLRIDPVLGNPVAGDMHRVVVDFHRGDIGEKKQSKEGIVVPKQGDIVGDLMEDIVGDLPEDIVEDSTVEGIDHRKD